MKEKWSKGVLGGTVVSDAPCADPDHLEYYGGHLVAESIAKKEYVSLIAAAPDLLQALRDCADYFHDFTEVDKEETRLAAICRAAIAKAKGEI